MKISHDLAQKLRDCCKHNEIVTWTTIAQKAAAELERLQSSNDMLLRMADAAEELYWAGNKAILATVGTRERLFDELRLLGRYPPSKDIIEPELPHDL